MAPPGSAHPAFGLGGFVIIGGTIGYLKKGSKASLGAGLVCGSLLISSGILITSDDPYRGHLLATGTSGVLALGMGHRYVKTGKFMPVGLVAALGIISMAYHAKKTIEWAE